MELSAMLAKVKQHPDYHKAGMILCHNGVVRQTSRDGAPVSGLKVTVDHEKLEQIIQENRSREGIVDIQIWINEGKALSLGDDVMFLVVAGDIRENVIDTLSRTLNQVKTEATSKTQFFKEAQ